MENERVALAMPLSCRRLRALGIYMNKDMETRESAVSAIKRNIGEQEARIAEQIRFVRELNEERHPVLFDFATKELTDMTDSLRKLHQDLEAAEERLRRCKASNP